MTAGGEPLLATTEQRARIFEHMGEALRAQDDEAVARAAFERIKTGHWRIRSVFDRADDGTADVASLRYVVDVDAGDQWVELVRIPWEAINLSMDQVLYEHRTVQRQHEDGTYPGGDADPYA